MNNQLAEKLQELAAEYLTSYTESEFAVIIAYLLDDFIKGDYTNDGQKIMCKLKNGQTFIINVEKNS